MSNSTVVPATRAMDLILINVFYNEIEITVSAQERGPVIAWKVENERTDGRADCEPVTPCKSFDEADAQVNERYLVDGDKFYSVTGLGRMLTAADIIDDVMHSVGVKVKCDYPEGTRVEVDLPDYLQCRLATAYISVGTGDKFKLLPESQATPNLQTEHAALVDEQISE